VTISVREVRFAWAVLVVVAAISHPGFPNFSPGFLAGLLAPFLPGTLLLASRTPGARVAEGLRRLLGEVKGRVSLLAAIVLVILVGFTFNAFAAFALIGIVCGLAWAASLVSRSRPWEERLTQWTAAGLSVYLTLAAADWILNWGPVARRLGTPAELAQWSRRYDRLRETNLFRFRSRYEDTRRRPGVRRVIALGDSFTYGSKIATADSAWPVLLEHVLEQPPDGLPTEVINMGHGGYSTGNEAELLRRVGWQFKPDLVILQWLDNDAHVALPNFENDEPEQAAVTVVPDDYRSGWIRRSAILALLEGTLNARFYGVLKMSRKNFAPDSPGWLALQDYLREMGDSAGHRCTPIVLVLYPYMFPGHWTPETYPERDIHEQVAAAGARAGFAVLDLLPTFLDQKRDFKDWWGTAYDSHPGGAAQVVAAKRIAAYIREHRLLAGSAGANRCQH
jgi:lysophospholipase L1-like esterase